MPLTHELEGFKVSKSFLIGIDSDGCVFDSMEIKHKECFCPAFINVFDLQPVARYAREVWEFVNLYSTSRGWNRFPALIRALDLVAGRPEVRSRGVAIPRLQGLRDWVARETRLANAVLEAEAAHTGDPDLLRALRWSSEVNAAVSKIVRNVPPFPMVRESLERMQAVADILVVSQTPTEALLREWDEHRLRQYPRLIAGQELGTKTEHLRLAAGGKYASNQILMLGDAPGDLEAARKNGALFFPVNPGREAASWRRFASEALDRFLAGTYAGAYEAGRVAEFEALLPDAAPWPT